MSYRYFAYGATLDPEHVAEWCGEHGFPVPTLEGLPAALDEWALAINVPSRTWLGAVGTIEPRPGATVYGMLFEVPEEQADVIRHKEGVASGLFVEVEVEVRILGPDAEDATIQLMAASAFRAAEGRGLPGPQVPSQRWLDVVARGAAARGLPETWVAELKRRSPSYRPTRR